jgi:TPP-dependent 2-oxoacid decarboxylase
MVLRKEGRANWDVVLTTMGVGEMSAINGIAGAYSESVKLISIVGTVPTAARNGGRSIHHSLGQNPDHFVCDMILDMRNDTDISRCMTRSRRMSE